MHLLNSIITSAMSTFTYLVSTIYVVDPYLVIVEPLQLHMLSQTKDSNQNTVPHSLVSDIISLCRHSVNIND